MGLGESLRAGVRRQGLGVSTICPGFVTTNLFGSALSGYTRRPAAAAPAVLVCLRPSPWPRSASRHSTGPANDPDHAAGHLLYGLSRFAPGLIDFANRLGPAGGWQRWRLQIGTAPGRANRRRRGGGAWLPIRPGSSSDRRAGQGRGVKKLWPTCRRRRPAPHR